MFRATFFLGEVVSSEKKHGNGRHTDRRIDERACDSFSRKPVDILYIHTHTHIYIYIYIYARLPTHRRQMHNRFNELAMRERFESGEFPRHARAANFLICFRYFRRSWFIRSKRRKRRDKWDRAKERTWPSSSRIFFFSFTSRGYFLNNASAFHQRRGKGRRREEIKFSFSRVRVFLLSDCFTSFGVSTQPVTGVLWRVRLSNDDCYTCVGYTLLFYETWKYKKQFGNFIN